MCKTQETAAASRERPKYRTRERGKDEDERAMETVDADIPFRIHGRVDRKYSCEVRRSALDALIGPPPLHKKSTTNVHRRQGPASRAFFGLANAPYVEHLLLARIPLFLLVFFILNYQCRPKATIQ
jgi:hypothetical protein